MHKNATKCNKTQSKWCINKHGASKIIDTFETYQGTRKYTIVITRGVLSVANPESLGTAVQLRSRAGTTRPSCNNESSGDDDRDPPSLDDACTCRRIENGVRLVNLVTVAGEEVLRKRT
jgi:hypothetical protein